MKIVFINDIPKFKINAGTVVSVSDFDVETNEYIVHPSEFGEMLTPNYRFTKGVNAVELKTKEQAKEIIDILRKIHPNIETLYEDVIKNDVGIDGLVALRMHHLIESCAVINNRKLYAL